MADSVCVVMATYNGARFLSAQIDSVLCQLRAGDELIVVDDASTDETREVLESYSADRIRLAYNPTNLGVLRSFERGLGMTGHDVVFLCDQDDVWLPGKREAFAAAFAEDPRCYIVVSDAQVIDESGRLLMPSYMNWRGGFRYGFFSNLIRNRYLGCAMAIRRNVLVAGLPIPAYVPMHDMWLGSIGTILGRVRYLPGPLLQYRRHGNNATVGYSRSWGHIIRWRVQLLVAVAIRLVRLAAGYRYVGFSEMQIVRRSSLPKR